MSLAQSRVTLTEVLELLSSDTQTRSTFGAALERARDGVDGGTPDYVRLKLGMEMRMLKAAATVRCLDGLAAYKSIRYCPIDDIRRFARRVRMEDGEAVVSVMRRYQPWHTSKPTQGLVAVYEWMRSRLPSMAPIDAGGEADAAQAFLVGKSAPERRIAAVIVADAELATMEWVRRWNEGVERAGRKAS